MAVVGAAMSDFLQFAACFLLPIGFCLFLLQFVGVISAIGFGIIVAASLLWIVGREMNILKQKNEVDAYNREMLTGWSADEIHDLEGNQ